MKARRRQSWEEPSCDARDRTVAKSRRVAQRPIATRENTYPNARFDSFQTWESVEALCPEDQRRDHYALKIHYRPGRQILELGSLRKYLRGFRTRTLYHESLANQIFTDILHSVRPRVLEVEVISRRTGYEHRVRRVFYAKGE